MMSKENYLTRWSTLHGDYDVDASPLVRGWLTIAYRLSAPLVRSKVAPSAITMMGVVVAATGFAIAAAGGVWVLLAAAFVLCAALVDSLDGAVAVLRHRESPYGYVIDSVADRCSDLLFFATLTVVGAPVPLVLAMAILTMLQETARARATGAGLNEIAVVTVWERPSRVITTIVTLCAVALVPSHATVSAAIGSSVGVLLAAVGIVQFLVIAGRLLALHHNDIEPHPSL